MGGIAAPPEAVDPVVLITRTSPPEGVQPEPALKPRKGHVWSPGFWMWNGAGHRWVEGEWIKERSGHAWRPARWHYEGERWLFSVGHWIRE